MGTFKDMFKLTREAQQLKKNRGQGPAARADQAGLSNASMSPAKPG
jgi:hypothetical protein